jgi:ferredoxin-NADP reductase
MEAQVVKILSIERLTHDVRRYRTEKPANYHFIPGQATEVSISKPGWHEQARPFTFTALPDAPYLEFTIKSYADHSGVTAALDHLVHGDELIVHEVFGVIQYRGPGLFIAGGAGITPFLAIFRDLARRKAIAGNRLILANKTEEDIILPIELEAMLGSDVHHILSKQINPNYLQGYLTAEMIARFLNPTTDLVYVCGPEAMMTSVGAILAKAGIKADQMVVEL